MQLPDKDTGCHRTGFEKNCRELVTSGRCKRWVQIQGANPNTGEPINESRCVDDWTHTLLIENSQMQRQTGAAVESLRNENATVNATAIAALQSLVKVSLLEDQPRLHSINPVD